MSGEIRAASGAKEINLSFIKIIDTFTFYGIDISLLATLTVLLTQLLKVTLFRRAQKKLVTFLPFIIGTFAYAVYAAVRNLSFCYLLDEYVSILEHGISVGAVSTLYYILYEQFVRRSNLSETEKIISTLIEGYIPSEHVEKAAKAVAEAIERDVTGNGAKRAEEILTEYSGGEINERDVHLLSRLIIETLAHLTTK